MIRGLGPVAVAVAACSACTGAGGGPVGSVRPKGDGGGFDGARAGAGGEARGRVEGTLSGVAAGGPARVFLVSVAGNGCSGLASAPVGAGGRFRFDALSASAYVLWAMAPGVGVTPTLATVAAGATSRVGLGMRPLSAVTGRVLGAGARPLFGATVRVRPTGTLGLPALPCLPRLESTTDQSGWFRIPQVPEGPVVLAATAKGYRGVARLAAVPAVGTPVLRLLPLFFLSGRVLGRSGAVRVRADGLGGESAEASVAADGVFQFKELPAGLYDLRAHTVTPPWQASAPAVGVEVGPGSHRVVELPLLEGERVTGRVTTGGGPVAGAQVVLASRAPQLWRARAVTDRAGRFSLEPVVRGSYRLDVWAPGFLPLSGHAVEVPCKVDTDVTLRTGAELSGLVVDGAGRPVKNALLRAVRDEGRGQVARAPRAPRAVGELGVVPGPVPRIPLGEVGVRLPEETPGLPAWTAMSADSGAFALRGLPPGRTRLVVEHPAFGHQHSAWVVLAEGGRSYLRVELTPPRSGREPVAPTPPEPAARVTGTVLDPRRQPVAGAFVAARQGGKRQQARTGTGGRFSLEGLGEGRVELEATHPRYGGALGSAAPGEDVQLELLPLGRLDGRVVDHGSGALLRRFQVEVRGPLLRKTVAGDHGQVALHLPPGTYRLRISASGYGTAVEEVTVRHPDREGVTPELRVALSRAGTIVGSVRDGRGFPLRGARVVVGELSGTTRGDGSFVVSAVPEGTHVVRVALPGGGELSSEPVVVRGGQTTTAVRLEAPVR
ncbi:MAG: carboxypeptidase regulatory-like domain-containing protein [Deltaproteobacteria bacterium]|nr:carboxypeptidase regulatory-like domain-containing protein [Deltaproteobacteria bacterium]